MSHDAAAIVERLNASGYRYFGHAARAWSGDNVQRIYFGSEYVTIAANGRVHNERWQGRGYTIRDEAVQAVRAQLR